MGKFSSRITAVRTSVTVVFLEQLVLSSLTLNQSFNEVQSRFFFISPLFCPYRSEIVPCRFMTQFFIAVPFSPLNMKITRSRRAPGEIYQRANVFAKKKKKGSGVILKDALPSRAFETEALIPALLNEKFRKLAFMQSNLSEPWRVNYGYIVWATVTIGGIKFHGSSASSSLETPQNV